MLTDIPSEVLLKDALDAMPQQIAVLGREGVILYANAAWEHSESSPPLYARRGANYLEVCRAQCEMTEEAYSRQIYSGLCNVLAGSSEQFSLEYAHLTDSGEKWFMVHIKSLAPGGAIVSHFDVTSRRRFERELERVAYTDALTGLPNRHAFFERAAQMIALAKRHARELQLLYIDLNGFKHVNDTLGHDAGDRLLVEVAKRFKRQMRASDLLARLGGDEFVCLLEVHPHGSYDASREEEYGGAKQVAERYAACLAAPFRLEGKEVHLDASIGVVQFPQEGSTLRTLLKEADDRMYKDKHRNKVRVAAREVRAVQRVSWEDFRPS